MDLLRLATAGSVDDGKSTLIGRLLLDAKLILEDQLEALESHNGDGPDLASITDGLRAEREQGITIDVAYRFFQTDRRSFIIADTPGHERYTRNMVSGASTAELGLILIDARSGIVDQSRRHACLSALLGHPAPGRVRQQDGPRRLGRGALPRDRVGVPPARRPAGGARRHGDPDRRAARRQRRRALGRRALVRRAAAARAPRDRGGASRSDRRRAAAAGPVDDPPARRARRRAQLRRPARGRRAGAGRRGRGDAGRRAHDGRGGRHATTGRSSRPSRRCRSPCGSPTTSTSAAATSSARPATQPLAARELDATVCLAGRRRAARRARATRSSTRAAPSARRSRRSTRGST